MGLLSSIKKAVSSVNPLAAAASSTIDAISGSISQNSANAKNKRQWQRERGWEETKMRNAHQWEAEDLKAAGLNPTLTAGGSGAIGSGSPHAEMGAASFGNFGKDFIANYGTLESLNQAKELNESTSFKNTMEGIRHGKEAGVVDQRTENETRDSLSKASEAQTERMKAKTDQEKAKAEIEERASQTLLNKAYTSAQEIENDFNNDDYIKALKKINATIETAKNAGGAISEIVIKPFTMLQTVKSAKEGLAMMKEFKKSGVFDIMKMYAKPKHKKHK